jgi:hypothetical protein
MNSELNAFWLFLILVNGKCSDPMTKLLSNVSGNLFVWMNIQTSTTSFPIFAISLLDVSFLCGGSSDN